MCGIVGAAFKLSKDINFKNKFNNALSLLNHRGPDMRDTFVYKDQVFLGHTRLSILDLSISAIQPMSTNNDNLVLTYNGEIYNYLSLKDQLSLSNFHTQSDTEVLLRGYEKIGNDIFKRLNGMFSLGIYDKINNKLILARDRLGIKPLYYSITEHHIYFSSEIKSLIELNSEDSECNISSLNEWLFYGNSLGSNTLFKGIKQLMPGHFLELDLGTFNLTLNEYWSIKQIASLPKINTSISEKANEVKKLLHSSVKNHLVSDVPVGIFLSGGIDSSAITAIASKHSKGKLSTYTAGFDYDKGDNELKKARELSSYFKTDHHEMNISGFDIADTIEKMIKSHDMPFSDAANIPLYLMSNQISSMSKVVLQGDGGDELFGGYKRYTTLSYYPILRNIANLGKNLNRILPKTAHFYRRERYFDAFNSPDLSETFAMLMTEENGHSIPSMVFNAHLRNKIQSYDPFLRYKECQKSFSSNKLVDQMSYIDSSIVLPDIFLEKVDRSTMSASIEARVPFLDNDLVEYVMRIPGNQKVSMGRKKYLLKLALKDIVPKDVLFGKKTGFSVPYGYWLRTSLKDLFFDNLNAFNLSYPGLLNNKYILRLFEEHISRKRDRSFILWKLLNFILWAKIYKIKF